MQKIDSTTIHTISVLTLIVFNHEKIKIKILARIHIGHTNAAHQWLLKKSVPAICNYAQNLNPFEICKLHGEHNINLMLYLIILSI